VWVWVWVTGFLGVSLCGMQFEDTDWRRSLQQFVSCECFTLFSISLSILALYRAVSILQ